MSRNYFKVRGTEHLFFFDDNVPESVHDAFAAASAVGGVASVFRPVPTLAVAIVGHRPRKDIVADIDRASNPETVFWLKEELAALDKADRWAA